MLPRSAFRLASFISVLSMLGASQAISAQGSNPSTAAGNQVATDSYAKEPYVFELLEKTVRFEADGKGQRDLTFRVRIQSESAVREYGLLVYPFASGFETLDVDYVRVRKPDGTVLETPAADIQEIETAVSRVAPMYTDEREKHIAVKSLGVGDILETHLRWVIQDPMAPGHFWYDQEFFRSGICLRESLTINVPRNIEVKLRSSETQPTIREEGPRRIYSFQHSNLKKQPESKIPEWERNAHGATPPEIQLSTFSSWDEVGKWFAGLDQPKVLVTPEIQSKADELTKGKTDEEEKVRALYDFVSTRFRYIGIDLGHSRYTPHAASEVMQNRYGDCKDKQVLLAALLQAEGIRSYPALISSKFAINPAFPTMSLFDHVITSIPRGDRVQFLDATPEVAPLGFLAVTIRDRAALVIPDGASPHLVSTPADPPSPSYEHFRSEASISADGTLDAKMRLEDRGDSELALRAVYRATPQNRWDKLTQGLANGIGFAGNVSDVVIGQPEDTDRPFVIEFSYRRTDYPFWKEKRVTLPMPPIFLRSLTEEQKQSPGALPLGPLQEISYEAVVKFPEGFRAIVPAKTIEHRTDFAEFTAVFSVDDRAVHGTYHLKTLLREVPGRERSAYSDFASQVDEATRRFIFVSSESTSSVASTTKSVPSAAPAALTGRKEVKILAPDSDSHNGAQPSETKPNGADALYQAAQRAQNNSDFEGATRILEDAVAKDPKHKSAWNSLGWTYNRLRQYQKAETALRKAIEINGSDTSAYNNLGNALVGQKRYEEAIPQFLKQIEINPGDKWAHTNLGRAYLVTKRYRKATAELEGASTITPGDPSIPFLLARAYHGDGHDEQAVQQFQKSVDLDPIPSRWNSVAYEMALEGLALDRAEHFAHLAIEATEARLKDVSLERVSTDVARLPPSLGAYWDTMGWIKFQQGDLAAAEKYVASAWPLQTNGVVADHLGQIYGKQGRKAEAIRMYSLALAAPGAVPETQQRLASLIGKDVDVTHITDEERPNLERYRTFHLKNTRKLDGFAEFWLLFEPATEISAAKFVSGDDNMRAFDVDKTEFDGVELVCPDSSQIKLPRRSRVTCSSMSGICSATLSSLQSSASAE